MSHGVESDEAREEEEGLSGKREPMTHESDEAGGKEGGRQGTRIQRER